MKKKKKVAPQQTNQGGGGFEGGVLCGNGTDTAPLLMGMRADDRLTLSQQGVALGFTSVQIELSLRLRRALKEDPAALRGFARAVTGAWMECCGASAL